MSLWNFFYCRDDRDGAPSRGYLFIIMKLVFGLAIGNWQFALGIHYAAAVLWSLALCAWTVCVCALHGYGRYLTQSEERKKQNGDSSSKIDGRIKMPLI